MIAVVDIGVSNVNSVSRALAKLNIDHRLTADTREIQRADKLILPGVGTFREASRRMVRTGLNALIREMVLVRSVPILGICLGMQLLADHGDEGGSAEGLALIKGKVVKLRSNLRLPHVGWNDVSNRGVALLKGIPDGSCFYFVHSFVLAPAEPVKVAVSDYGGEFVAALEKQHIYGTQFHPEKSQTHGMQVLMNFCMANG